MDAAVFLLVAGGFILILFIFGIIGDRRTRRESADAVSRLYGSRTPYRFTLREREHIRSYFDNHVSEGQIDDITWNDLQMDDVFEQMNYTQSQAGSEYLYYMLRTPSDGSGGQADGARGGDLGKLTEQTGYYMQHDSDRESLMLQFHDAGGCGVSGIYDYLGRIRDAKPFPVLPYILMDAMLALSIVFMFFVPSWGILVFLGVVIFNICFYFTKKHQMDPYLHGFSYTLRLLETAGNIASMAAASGFEDEKKELSVICSEMKGFRRGSFLVMSGGSSNPLEIILDYLRMVLGIDMIMFSHMLSAAQNSAEAEDRLISILGRMDAVLSLCCYRAYLGDKCCTPQLYGSAACDEKRIDASDIYHPLIKEPVLNSVHTERSILITGSNASGKSTFLKTAALCALMSQTVGICPAASYRAPYFRIISSMSLSDDIRNGSSYYMTEIKAIGRMADAVKKTAGEMPVLCFIDEVLRGTNTVERIAASAQILKFFSENGAVCFAATHDTELTSMLDGYYDNYHFSEEIKDGVISFPYRLDAGRAVSRNAIRLLEAMGYDEKIVSAAEISAEDFISEGEWHI